MVIGAEGLVSNHGWASAYPEVNGSQGALCFTPDHLSVSASIMTNRIESFCNQLLPDFSSNQCETSHKCYRHIEDVHVTF